MSTGRKTGAYSGALAGFAPWTPNEDAALVEAYTAGGIYAARAALPGRSQNAIFHRTRRLKLQRRRRWTASDDRRLVDLWGTRMKLGEIARELGRTLQTTYVRAQGLGLPLGVPAGFEYLTAAAERTGFDTGQLRQILRWAKAPISVTRSRPQKGPTRHFHYVDWLDVDEAIEKWLKTEPLEAAARRVGVSAEYLRARLLRLGLTPPRHKHRWRIAETDVARALAFPMPRPGTYQRIRTAA